MKEQKVRCDLSVVLFCIMVGSITVLFFFGLQYVLIHLINARIMEYIRFFNDFICSGGFYYYYYYYYCFVSVKLVSQQEWLTV